MYFFLKDGDRMLQTVFEKIPMRRTGKSEILSKFLSVTRATIKGTVVIGLFQGAIEGVVIGILGVPGALVWGVLLVFLGGGLVGMADWWYSACSALSSGRS
ncbi:MAG: AI-2E family transporter [Spirochaetota bacterium]